MAPVVPLYRPAAPRPPQEPERRGWLTTVGYVVGWGVIAAALVFIGVSFVRGGTARATAKAELAAEEAHMEKVIAWVRDTSAQAPMPERVNRPAPTSEKAKRIWVISRMMEERFVWWREVMERHGVKATRTPPAWGTARYQANARSYPEVATYVEGRAAAIDEIQKNAGTWQEERIAALARESGMPADEIRTIFPGDFAAMTADAVHVAAAMLALHRQFVRMDPRVHFAGGDQLRFESEDDIRRVDELAARVRQAIAYSNQEGERRQAQAIAALYREMK